MKNILLTFLFLSFSACSGEIRTSAPDDAVLLDGARVADAGSGSDAGPLADADLPDATDGLDAAYLPDASVALEDAAVVVDDAASAAADVGLDGGLRPPGEVCDRLIAACAYWGCPVSSDPTMFRCDLGALPEATVEGCEEIVRLYGSSGLADRCAQAQGQFYWCGRP